MTSLVGAHVAPGSLSAATTSTPAWSSVSGNTLVVLLRWEDAIRTPVVTDTAGNTYTALTVYGATDVRAQIHYCLNPTGNVANVVTVNFGSATPYIVMEVTEWTGTLTLDDNNGGVGSGDTIACPVLTASKAGLAIASAASYNGQTAVTGNNGFTATLVPLGTDGEFVARAHKIVGSAGTETPSVLFGANTTLAIAGAYFSDPAITPPSRHSMLLGVG